LKLETQRGHARPL